MKKIFLWVYIVAVLLPVGTLAASLQNTDSQSYDLQILETGRPYPSQYTIIENAQVEICFNGCEITLLSTGQTVRVGPKDAVVIDNGVMNVTAGN